MKPYMSVVVFLILLFSAVGASIDSYRTAERRIVEDMNQALSKTLAEEQTEWITPDTIHSYRQNLRIDELRNRSYVYYADANRTDNLCSQRMKGRSPHATVALQGYANCSFATVWGLADHRLPWFFALMMVGWMFFSLRSVRRQRLSGMQFGSLVYVENERRFYNKDFQPVSFTPMQQQLLEMFFVADQHCLSKEAICERLWPRKPDASETLYTLIRRLKPIVEQQGRLKIVSERGRSYRLESDCQTNVRLFPGLC